MAGLKSRYSLCGYLSEKHDDRVQIRFFLYNSIPIDFYCDAQPVCGPNGNQFVDVQKPVCGPNGKRFVDLTESGSWTYAESSSWTYAETGSWGQSILTLTLP